MFEDSTESVTPFRTRLDDIEDDVKFATYVAVAGLLVALAALGLWSHA